jgi:ribosomal protein L37E
MPWDLKCLQCEYTDTDLVRIQEHAMAAHGYTQDDHRKAQRRKIRFDRYIWTMPDGKDWLDAVMKDPSITCPRCGMTSYNPNDIQQGYCGNCNDWTYRSPG